MQIVLQLAQERANDHDPATEDGARIHEAVNLISDRVSPIRVIQDTIDKLESRAGKHVFKANSVLDGCLLCGECYAHNNHA